MATDDNKLKIGQEVFILERDLTIASKRVLAIINEEKEIKYKLDVHSCGGISAKELFITKNKAEVVKQDFLDGLKFVVGDLLIFYYKEWNRTEISIGRLAEIAYSKEPYRIKTSCKSIYDVTDDSIVLKIKNEYIENFGRLQELNVRIDEVVNEFSRLETLIKLEYGLLEKDLKKKFKRQFSHSWFSKKKPLFKDRFNYDDSDDDD